METDRTPVREWEGADAHRTLDIHRRSGVVQGSDQPKIITIWTRQEHS